MLGALVAIQYGIPSREMFGFTSELQPSNYECLDIRIVPAHMAYCVLKYQTATLTQIAELAACLDWQPIERIAIHSRLEELTYRVADGLLLQLNHVDSPNLCSPMPASPIAIPLFVSDIECSQMNLEILGFEPVQTRFGSSLALTDGWVTFILQETNSIHTFAESNSFDHPFAFPE